MGDTGSTTLGFLLAVLVLRAQADGVPIIAAALPLLPFLLDSGATLAIRFIRRERFWLAHRQHFYQRLLSLGWSHTQVALTWMGLALFCASIAIGYLSLDDTGRAVALAVAIALHVIVALLIILAQRGTRPSLTANIQAHGS
jgi:UDP-N-acetylmuramyl pentapeptide phosphotransferase/UDP-N-acetylglucosamine-1-phosphate transferase